MTTSNITATKTVTPAAALPGQTVEVKVRLDASGTDRYMQDYTDYAPADYVLQSVAARVWRSGPTLVTGTRAANTMARPRRTRRVL
ncbi:hypothetical protein GS923_07665 [Rhodococcus hoagii]|nr:hypothetical protein [Prescottella equi]